MLLPINRNRSIENHVIQRAVEIEVPGASARFNEVSKFHRVMLRIGKMCTSASRKDTLRKGVLVLLIFFFVWYLRTMLSEEAKPNDTLLTSVHQAHFIIFHMCSSPVLPCLITSLNMSTSLSSPAKQRPRSFSRSAKASIRRNASPSISSSLIVA